MTTATSTRTTTPTLAPSTPLVFFTRELALRSPTNDTAPPTDGSDHAQRLAAELITPPDQVAWPHPIRVMRDSKQRVIRAQLLLAEAERLETAGSPGEADEAWTQVEDEWGWVARENTVREQLLARARQLAIPQPEDVVSSIRDGITKELLPVLHLKWALAGRSPASRHLRSLRQWQLPKGASPALLDAYGWYLLALMESSEEPPSVVDTTIRRMVHEHGRENVVVRRLLWYYATLRTRLVRRQINANARPDVYVSGLAAARAVVEAGGGTLAMLELLSVLHLMNGVHAPPQRVDVAAMQFAQALVLDPLNGTARDRLAALEELPSSLRARAQELANRGQLRVGAYESIAAIEKGVKDANAYFDSPRAKEIAQQRSALLLSTLAWRLSLDPSDPAQLDRAATLWMVIDSLVESGVAPKDYPALVRSRATQRRADLASLPWDRIDAVLTRGVLPAAYLLPLLLQEPDPPQQAAVAQPVRAAVARVERSRALPTRPRRWWLDEWLVSSRDRGYKVAAAAGIIMALYVAGARTVHAVEAGRASRAFERVAVAARSRDDSATAEVALAYLSGRDSTEVPDARSTQVEAWLGDAMMRRVLTLVDAKRVDEAKSLLERFERARPLRGEAESSTEAP